jgi:hypothetical protein
MAIPRASLLLLLRQRRALACGGTYGGSSIWATQNPQAGSEEEKQEGQEGQRGVMLLLLFWPLPPQAALQRRRRQCSPVRCEAIAAQADAG